MGRTLLLDVGGSNWRAHFTDNGQSRTARSRALPPIASGELSRERLEAGLDEIWSSLDDPESFPELVAIATAGMARLPGRIDLFHDGLKRWDTVTDTLVISDAAAGLAGALGKLQDGCLLSVGTGVAAVARSKDGNWTFKDGWGPLLGDEGGGYWIGAEGLRAALRHLDQRSGGSPALAAMAVEEFGEELESWPLRGDLEGTVQRVAAVSAAVGAAAEGGDEVAIRIVGEACSLLLDTARSISAGREVHVAGGVVESSFVGRSLMSLADELGLVLVEPRGDGLFGLRLIDRYGPETFMAWVGTMGDWKRWV